MWSDLAALSKLTNLKYVSLGRCDGQSGLLSKEIKPYIDELPSLQRLWLDGIELTEAEQAIMVSQYEYFRC